MGIEIWRDIKGFEGIYQISNLGDVKSLARWIKNRNGMVRNVKEKILKPYEDVGGYLTVKLPINNKQKTYRVHRLVAEAFIPNPNNYPFINHKDENKKNNNVNNLEWCTAEYNLNYGTRNERCMKKVTMIDASSGEKIKTFSSLKEVEETLGISHSKVSCVCHGKRKTAGGYSWRFYENK